MICWVLAMEMLQGVWKQHLRPRAVVGYGVKIFLPSPPNYVTRSPGGQYNELEAMMSLWIKNSMKLQDHWEIQGYHWLQCFFPWHFWLTNKIPYESKRWTQAKITHYAHLLYVSKPLIAAIKQLSSCTKPVHTNLLVWHKGCHPWIHWLELPLHIQILLCWV